MSFINDFLRSVLDFISGLVLNQGLAVIIFTTLMLIVLLPFDYKSRKGMSRMTKIQPQLAALQKKYANDKQKLQQKQYELYKKENVSMFAGCLPMLLQWPIMIAMFAAMRAIANENLARQAFEYLSGNANPVLSSEVFLWIRNIWMTDSPFTSIAPDLNSLSMIPLDAWQKAFAALSPEQLTLIAQHLPADVVLNFETSAAMKESITVIMNGLQTMPAYISATSGIPGWTNMSLLITRLTVYQQYNGLLILPVLAGLTQVLQTKLNPQMQQQQPAGDQQKGMGNMMRYMFPIISVFFCLTSNAGFALYWVTSNVVRGITSVLITRYLEKQDAKSADAISGEGSIK